MTKSNNNIEEIIEELSLLLMYLTRFREKDYELWQAWKGYDFKIMDNLQEKEYISFSYRAKRLYLHEKGMEKVKQFLKKYEIKGEV